MRKALPESSLEQPRLQIHYLALHQPIGANRPDINYTNRTMNEAVLEDVTVKALNRILRGRKEFLSPAAGKRSQCRRHNRHPPAGRYSDSDGGTTKGAHHEGHGKKQSYNAIADEFFRLHKQKEKAAVDSHRRTKTMNRIKELQDFIGQQETEVTVFDEEPVRRLIEKITVFIDHFTVEFKSGVSVNITKYKWNSKSLI